MSLPKNTHCVWVWLTGRIPKSCLDISWLVDVKEQYHLLSPHHRGCPHINDLVHQRTNLIATGICGKPHPDLTKDIFKNHIFKISFCDLFLLQVLLSIHDMSVVAARHSYHVPVLAASGLCLLSDLWPFSEGRLSGLLHRRRPLCLSSYTAGERKQLQHSDAKLAQLSWHSHNFMGTEWHKFTLSTSTKFFPSMVMLLPCRHSAFGVTPGGKKINLCQISLLVCMIWHVWGTEKEKSIGPHLLYIPMPTMRTSAGITVPLFRTISFTWKTDRQML